MQHTVVKVAMKDSKCVDCGKYRPLSQEKRDIANAKRRARIKGQKDTKNAEVREAYAQANSN